MIKTMKDDNKTNKYNHKMDKKKPGTYFTNVFYEYNISGYTLYWNKIWKVCNHLQKIA